MLREGLAFQRRPRGVGQIPMMISKWWESAERFIVIFDPDERDPEQACEDLWHRVWERLNKDGKVLSSEQWGPGTYLIYDQNRREVLIRFWPARVASQKLPPPVRDLRAHSIEDYLLCMGLQDKVLDELLNDKESHPVRNAERLSPPRFREKWEEILQLLKNNGAPAESAKRAFEFYRALLGYRGGIGELGARIVQRMPEAALREVFGGLFDLLETILEAEAPGRDVPR